MINKKYALLGVVALLSTTSLNAGFFGDGSKEESRHYDGYAYMNFGLENVHYVEKPTAVPFALDATTSNIVQMSGGLTRVNDLFDFSIDSIATLAMNEGSEEWRSTANLSNIDGSATLSNGQLAQTNSYTLQASQLQILLHYKYTSNIRLLAGVTSANQTFKRYDWNSKSALIDEDTSLIEESYTSIMGNIGAGYESYGPAHNADRFRVRAVFGLPFTHTTLNTSDRYNDLEFDENEGYNAELDVYWGYTAYKGVELGVFVNASRQYRKAGGQQIIPNVEVLDTNIPTTVSETQIDEVSVERTTTGTFKKVNRVVQWPENTLDMVRTGISIVWKFRE